MHANHTDYELQKAVAAGDESAFTELFRRYHPKVYQAANMLTRSREIAEELVQDVFIKVWLQKENLEQVENFASYIFIMARNKAYDSLRSRMKRLELANALSSDITDNHTDDLILDNNYRKLVNQAVATLTAKQQLAYRLVKLDGLERAEAARLMGLSPETVKDHVEKAVKQVRAWMIVHTDLLPPGCILVLTLWLQLHTK